MIIKSNKGNSDLILILYILITIIIIVVAVNFNCKVEQGTIIDKKYASEISYTEYRIRNDEVIPYQRFISEKYYIKIQQEEKSIWIEVPKEKYFNLKIGDDYNKNT